MKTLFVVATFLLFLLGKAHADELKSETKEVIWCKNIESLEIIGRAAFLGERIPSGKFFRIRAECKSGVISYDKIRQAGIRWYRGSKYDILEIKPFSMAIRKDFFTLYLPIKEEERGLAYIFTYSLEEDAK